MKYLPLLLLTLILTACPDQKKDSLSSTGQHGRKNNTTTVSMPDSGARAPWLLVVFTLGGGMILRWRLSPKENTSPTK
jgi:hypothetical protein